MPTAATVERVATAAHSNPELVPPVQAAGVARVPLLDQPERPVPPAMAAEQVAKAVRAVIAPALRAATVAKVAMAGR
jgi:hypothetical protein